MEIGDIVYHCGTGDYSIKKLELVHRYINNYTGEMEETMWLCKAIYSSGNGHYYILIPERELTKNTDRYNRQEKELEIKYKIRALEEELEDVRTKNK